MDIFIFPIRIPKMISRQWLEDLYPDCSPAKAFEILEASIQNPHSVLLGVFETKTKELKGFLWGEGNPLDHSLFVNSIYIEKGCRKNPKFLGTLLDYVRSHFNEWGFGKVFFMTKKPSFFIKRGCRQFEEACIVLE